MNLANISSNLLLIGLVIIGLCCLYLLYSNFTKVMEIDELKHKMENIKQIFINQQQHNDTTFSKIIQMIQPDSQKDLLTNINNNDLDTDQSTNSNITLDDNVLSSTTKIINIDVNSASTPDNIIINKEKNIDIDIDNIIVDEYESDQYNDNNELILEELDKLDTINTDSNSYYTDDERNKHNNTPNMDDNMDDNISISTEPTLNIDELINDKNLNDFNIEEMTDEITDENIEELPLELTTTTTEHNITTTDKQLDESYNLDLNELLNCNENNDIKYDLKSMSFKQLKDLAKKHGLKTSGTKNDLISLLSSKLV